MLGNATKYKMNERQLLERGKKGLQQPSLGLAASAPLAVFAPCGQTEKLIYRTQIMMEAIKMPDLATPNLPSRQFEITARFYEQFGFEQTWKDAGWMILKRGDLILEFFPFPDLDPAQSSFSCCFRMNDVSEFFEILLSAGLPELTKGWPRVHRPKREPWGGLVGALIDPDGSLVRLVQAPN